nr:PREDICTED: uncharacterized protein LOC662380 isoform X1 [Tribolium castaneum]|eukprot:XP_008195175.1 PREDICTED: uncharacterized protein LOC662380 isoform X1 [Tribolium castaneum]
MKSFSKMVQKKRGKMLILSILLTLLALVHQSASINLTYIVKKEGDTLQPNCIAEENERYAAIGWIYPLSRTNQEPRITNKYVPTIQNNFNCNFAKNSKCNNIWALKNWEIDTNSTKTLDLLFDARWDNFPTILTGANSKEFEDKIEIPTIFKAGFSLRASASVELLICDGWNPYNHPCYHLNMSQNAIFLRKYMTLPKNISVSDKLLDSYQAFAKILSGDEWRNFVISLDDKGAFSLTDVSVNRTVIQYEDKEALKPLYLLVRSAQVALWKIHQNQFFYTKTVQTSRFGPLLHLPSKFLCVSLYVSTCPTCSMTFFIIKDGQKKILKDVQPTQDFQWRLVKIKDDNVESDKLNIFVETKSANNDGFWAVDDVRVCHENEVKVTFLKLENGLKEDETDEVSCQVVEHPKWRPKKLVYSEIKDFPTVDNSSNSSSIYLNWTQEDPNNQINYFITYEANDLCPPENPNLERVKSNGFLMTKHNEITINDLIPYTRYNITFSSMLHEKEKRIFVTTLESAQLSLEEIPSKLQIEVHDTQAYASWDKIACKSIYGPVLYALNLTNVKTNITKELGVQTEDTVEINDLQPFTTYMLEITTARNFENIQNNKNTLKIENKFTTQPGKAPPVENLEIYSIGKNTVSLRYDLPRNSRGVPVYGQVTRCNALTFKKCKTSNFPITPCKLWPRKYCIEMNNLIPYQNYTFKVSIRNERTQFYGDDVLVEAFLVEQVPGSPSNITYKIVDCKESLDYCHLNVSWMHPYNQNGSIESFHIVLNGTDNDTANSIQEVLKIFNSSYYVPRYEYQIKYIPYSTHYELFVQSANSKYKSPFAHVHVKTDDLGEHIDQNPILLKSEPTSVTFTLPTLDHRLKSYSLVVIVQDFNQNITIPTKITKNSKISDHLCHDFGDTWILQKLEVATHNQAKNLEIGTDKPLKPNTQYCFTFIVTNKYRNSEHDVVYYKKLTTPQSEISESGSNGLYALFLLLLLIPIGFFAYRYFKKRTPRRKRQQENNKENVYESLPFEETEENCVSNDTYDHLLHK